MRATILVRTVPVLALVALGCRTGLNYADPAGPRFIENAEAVDVDGRGVDDSLTIVSFNIAFGREVDRAVHLLRTEPGLRNPDVLLLQEVDDDAVRQIAQALGLSFVYYPAIQSLRTGRDFGNAVLSRWPIVEDAKLVLPNRALLGRTQRVATAATLRIRGVPVRAYSVHLGTLLEVGPDARRDQLRAVLADAAAYERVIIGGDMNSHGIGGLALAHGYEWPTRDGPRTTAFGRWDHVFTRGLLMESAAAGTLTDVRGASDHRPIWVRAGSRP